MNKDNGTEKIWLEGESNAWFKRNKSALNKKKDIVLSLLGRYEIKLKKVLEIGCANGFRLAALHEKYKAEVFGVEPSIEAIKNGKKKWPYIKFVEGLAHSFKTSEKFDLVIINFVFHWVDRRNLLKSVAMIDDIVNEGGLVCIGDFDTPFFLKRHYHHRQDVKLFTYKQRYHNIFLSTGLYKEVAAIIFDHDKGDIAANISTSNAARVSLLKKEQLYLPV